MGVAYIVHEGKDKKMGGRKMRHGGLTVASAAVELASSQRKLQTGELYSSQGGMACSANCFGP